MGPLLPGKSIKKRMRRPMWWVEQVGHCCLGFGPSFAVAYAGAHVGGLPIVLACFIAAVVGIVPGILRELLQNWNDPVRRGSLEDSLLDLSFWTLGGLLGILGAL